MTVSELLSNKMYRGNKSLLAKDLGITRTTLRKLIPDSDGVHHIIINEGQGEDMEVFINATNRIDADKKD